MKRRKQSLREIRDAAAAERLAVPGVRTSGVVSDTGVKYYRGALIKPNANPKPV